MVYLLRVVAGDYYGDFDLYDCGAGDEQETANSRYRCYLFAVTCFLFIASATIVQIKIAVIIACDHTQ